MILRRFMQHVKEQNWFAVGLDVIVVIVGIFLGLQVQAWYEDQEERKLEITYLERLHPELESVEEAFIRYRGSYLIYTKRFTEILEAITKSTDIITLDDDHCSTISNSHIYVETSISLPTMTELITSGNLSSLSDPELRNEIANYLINNERANQILDGFYSDRLELSSKYPSLINYEFGGDYSSFQGTVAFSCDFEAMRESQAFKNDLLMNARRMRVFNNGEIEGFELIQQIHSRVDKILSVNHRLDG